MHLWTDTAESSWDKQLSTKVSRLSCLHVTEAEGASFSCCKITRGGSRNSERGGRAPFPLASYINTFYFSENSMKILQNFKTKGWPGPLRSTAKSALDYKQMKLTRHNHCHLLYAYLNSLGTECGHCACTKIWFYDRMLRIQKMQGD